MHTYKISISETRVYTHSITVQSDKDINKVDSILDDIEKKDKTDKNIFDIKEVLKDKELSIKDTCIDEDGEVSEFDFDELEELE